MPCILRFTSIRNWSVGEFREFLLDGRASSAAIERVRKGLTSEMAAAVSKIMSNADLIFAAKENARGRAFQQYRRPAGAFLLAASAQRHAGRDPSIVAQGVRGLSLRRGDTVIGINPVTDTVENTKAMLSALWEIIERHRNPHPELRAGPRHHADGSHPAGRQRGHDLPEHRGQRKRAARIRRDHRPA